MGPFGKASRDLGQIDEKKLRTIDKWILTLYSELVEKVTQHMDNFEFDKARKLTVEFIWHELADHYLELVKYRIYRGEDEGVMSVLYHIGLGITKMIAPLLPHVTEEIYDKHFKHFDGNKSIHLTPWPEPLLSDELSKNDGTVVKDITTTIRRWKSEHGIPLNKELAFIGLVTDKDLQTKLEPMIEDIVETIKAKELKFEDRGDIQERFTAVKPVKSRIGPEFKGQASEIIAQLLKSDPETVNKSINDGGFELELGSGGKILIGPEFVTVDSTATLKGQDVESIKVGNVIVLIRE